MEITMALEAKGFTALNEVGFCMLWTGEHSAQEDQWVTQEPRAREWRS